MRVRTLEIRWHGGDPIYACDFQPLPQNALKKLLAPRIGHKDATSGVSQAYRFATAGGDNNVRIWMIYPNILPPSVVAASTTSTQPPPNLPPPRPEYLATLRKHTSTINVVRFSPNGEQLASAGDDGWLIIWTPTDRPVASFGVDPEETQYDKEHWKPAITVKATSREVYDLAWSPNGEWIICGSTDNTARVYNASDSTCIKEITDHSHYVQGVAWDPLGEYLASQSSDRSVHVYSVTTKRGPFEVHAIGKNARLSVKHSRTPSAPSSARPNYLRRGSTTGSDVESVITSASELREDQLASFLATPSTVATPSALPGTVPSAVATPASTSHQLPAPPTPTAASVTSTPSVAMHPPKERPASRRSSFSGSNAPSPAPSSRNIGRSPSPMPPLPAIRAAPSTTSWVNSFKMYGDESYTNFFRRLAFSPDGAFLLTPAGQFEDQSIYPSSRASSSRDRGEEPPTGRSKRSSGSMKSNSGHQNAPEGGSKSSVYIYSRANFSRPPVAHLPGHQKASVAVRFSPLLYELRQGVSGETPEVKKIAVERGKDQNVDLDLGGLKIGNPTPSSSSDTLPPPVTPAPSDSPISVPTGSVFSLPYRMLYAVATLDTVMIYDTQQSGPVCMFTNLHYSSFTDMAWAPDGQSLMLASSDGYCSIVVLDEILPLYHTQQHNLQMQSIVQSHAISSPHTTISHGHSASQSSVPVTPHSPALSIASTLPPTTSFGMKRSERSESVSSASALMTPSQSFSGGANAIGLDDGSSSFGGLGGSAVESGTESEDVIVLPVKKKRRIELKHHGAS